MLWRRPSPGVRGISVRSHAQGTCRRKFRRRGESERWQCWNLNAWFSVPTGAWEHTSPNLELREVSSASSGFKSRCDSSKVSDNTAPIWLLGGLTSCSRHFFIRPPCRSPNHLHPHHCRMASFFQPGSNDPAIVDCEPGRFQTYCNSILPSDPSTQPWHRLLNLAVGATALLVSISLLLLSFAKRCWRPRLSRTKSHVWSRIPTRKGSANTNSERETAQERWHPRVRRRRTH